MSYHFNIYAQIWKIEIHPDDNLKDTNNNLNVAVSIYQYLGGFYALLNEYKDKYDLIHPYLMNEEV